MTRDTLLLEFSQVRATPIDRHSSTFMSAEPLREKPFSLAASFCCSFNLSKKERWTQKSLLRGI